MADDQELMAKALAGLPATAPQPVAKGWLQYLQDFASGGLHGALKGTQQQLPAWTDKPAQFLQGENVNAALGMAGAPWKPGAVDMLKALRAKNTPVKDIANELGVTKNSVVGKLDRLGLTDPTNLGGDRKSPMAAFRTSTPRQQPTAPSGISVVDRTALELEGMLTKYAQGKLKAPDVQKAFKDKGWRVDLRRGTYDFEAHDPTGKMHYLTP